MNITRGISHINSNIYNNDSLINVIIDIQLYYNSFQDHLLEKKDPKAIELANQFFEFHGRSIKRVCDDLTQMTPKAVRAIGAVLQAGLENKIIQEIRLVLQWQLHPQAPHVHRILGILEELLTPEEFDIILKACLIEPQGELARTTGEYIHESIEETARRSDDYKADSPMQEVLSTRNRMIIHSIVPKLSAEWIERSLNPSSFPQLSLNLYWPLIALICAAVTDRQWIYVVMPVLQNPDYVQLLGHMPLNSTARGRLKGFVSYHLLVKPEIFLDDLSKLTRQLYAASVANGDATEWVEGLWQQICKASRERNGPDAVFCLRDMIRGEVEPCRWQIESFVGNLNPDEINSELKKPHQGVCGEYYGMFFVAANQHEEIDLFDLLKEAFPVDGSGLINDRYTVYRMMEMLTVLIQKKLRNPLDLQLFFKRCAERLSTPLFKEVVLYNPYENRTSLDASRCGARHMVNYEIYKAGSEEQQAAANTYRYDVF